MGGFALTANAQDVKKGQTTEAEIAKPAEKPKLGNQDNKESLQSKEYQKMVDEYQTAVNKFVNAYKEQIEKTENEKNKKPDLEGLMGKAEKLGEGIEPIFEKLSPSQKTTYKEAKKLFENTKKNFLKK